MIGASVLLYPESGPDFLRALKMSALYAEEVNTLAWVNFEVLNQMLTVTDELNMLKSRLPDDGLAVFKRAFTRMADHMDFLVANKKDFSTLQDEGILRFHDFVDSPDKNFSLTEVANQIRTLPPWDKEFDTSFRLLTPVFRGMPPSIADIFMFDAVRQAAIGNTLIEEQLNAGLYFTQFIGYLLYLILMAERRGVALYTWNNNFQQAIWTARKLLPQTDAVSKSLIPIREAAASQLANVILTRYLTRVDDLPFDEILSIRKKRMPELQGFRSGVAELATEIDLDASPPELELQLHDLVSAKVDPALRDLTSAIRSSRSEAILRMGNSSVATLTSVIGGATGALPASISLVTGPSIAMAGLVAVLGVVGSLAGGVVGVAIEDIANRNRLQSASQWAFLIELDDQRREKSV